MRLAIAAVATLLYAGTMQSCYLGKQAKGEHVVAVVEKFRRENGRLPSSLSEIGERDTEAGPIYYERKSDARYVVWYGTTLGESVTYDSDVRRWEDHD